MRELILLRHAHADPALPDQADIDRPLSAEGLAEAESAGRWLREQNLVPDCVLCSPSRRTRETLEAVLGVIGYVDQRLEPTVYDATPGTLAALLDEHRETGRLLLVGGDASNTKAIFDLFAGFPANCPPTVVVQHLGPGMVESMAEKLAEQCAPKVVVAADGMKPEQGTIYLAPHGDAHLVIDSWPNGTLRLLPLSFACPSAYAATMAVLTFSTVRVSALGMIRLTEYLGVPPLMDLGSQMLA